VNILNDVLRVLDSVLGLGGRTANFTRDTALLDAVPELDSMAVVALVSALEEHFGMSIDDEDLEGSTFATVGSLTDFVGEKLTI
jgi:acyl carrier protein